MRPTKLNADLVSLVMLAYGDIYGKGTRSLNFRTERFKAEAAAVVAALVPSYNEYDGEKVAEGIKRIAAICKDSYQLSFEFGRENSPVLYINIPFWIGEDPNRRPLTIEEKETMVRETQKIGGELAADENDLAYANTVRLWWD